MILDLRQTSICLGVGRLGGQLIRYYIKGKIQQLFSAGRIFGVLDKYISLGNRTSIKLFIVRHVFFQSRVWFSSIMPAILMLTTSTNLLLSITIRVMVSVTLREHYYTLIFMFLPLAWCVFFSFFLFFPEPHEKNKYCRNCQCPPASLFHCHKALNTKAADY